MWKRLVYNLGISCFASVCLVSAQVPESPCATVVLENEANPQSPVAVSGSVMLCEQEEGSQLIYWYKGELSLHNRAAKGLLAAVVIMDLQFPHGQKGHRRFQNDAFFSTVWIAPGRQQHSEFVSGVMRVPSGTVSRSTPAATSRMAFAQFVDGTFVGDQTSASDLLDIRGRMLAALRSLDNAYRRGNERDFVEVLERTTGRLEADNLLSRLKTIQINSGSAATVEEIRKMLGTAEARLMGRRTPSP